MAMDDPGYRGYRDEITMWFREITDSYIPKIELPMKYVYDEKHTWPSERLYPFIMKIILEIMRNYLVRRYTGKHETLLVN